MPIDPEIPLAAGRVPQTQGQNPLSTLEGFATLQNRLNQAQLFRQTFAARQQMGEIMASSPDVDTGLQRIWQSPLAPWAGEFANLARQYQLTTAQYTGELGKQAMTGFDAARKIIIPHVLSGGSWDSAQDAAMQSIKLLKPEVQGSVLDALNSLKSSMLDPVGGQPPNPATIQARLIGNAAAAGFTPETLSPFAGKTGTVETPTGVLAGTFAPLTQGGGFVPSTVISKGMAQQPVTGPGGQVTVAGGAAPSVTQLGAGGGGGVIARTPTATDAAPPIAAPRPQVSAGTPLAATAPARGGTIFGPADVEQAQEQEAIGKTGGEYWHGLTDRLVTGSRIQQNLMEARQALANFKPGAGAETYAGVARFAQALGADPKLVDRIGNGDLGATQEFQKLMVNTTMDQVRTQLSGIGASRLSQMEFATFMQNNPNVDTDPRAIEKIFNFWTKMYQVDHAEQGALLQHLQGGGRLMDWQDKWLSIAQKRGYIDPQITNISDDQINKALSLQQKAAVEAPGAPARPVPAGERPPLESFFK